MNFNIIIRKLGLYLNKPNIHKICLKEVFYLFYDSMSNQEKEVFKKKCSNKNFQLFKMLDLPEIQTSLDKFMKPIKLFNRGK